MWQELIRSYGGAGAHRLHPLLSITTTQVSGDSSDAESRLGRSSGRQALAVPKTRQRLKSGFFRSCAVWSCHSPGDLDSPGLRSSEGCPSVWQSEGDKIPTCSFSPLSSSPCPERESLGYLPPLHCSKNSKTAAALSSRRRWELHRPVTKFFLPKANIAQAQTPPCWNSRLRHTLTNPA